MLLTVNVRLERDPFIAWRWTKSVNPSIGTGLNETRMPLNTPLFASREYIRLEMTSRHRHRQTTILN